MTDWAGFRPCTCIAVDVAGYGGNNDRRQSEIQHELPRLLSRAASAAGLDRTRWRVQPQGDGQVALVPQDEGEPRLVDDYIRHLVVELRKYNQQRTGAYRMRMRAALHHGPVELADHGFAGRAVVATCRLLEADQLYQVLARRPDADLALMLSDDIFGTTVGAGHTTFVQEEFDSVLVRKKEYEHPAWLWVPGGAGRQRPDQEAAPAAQLGTSADNGGDLRQTVVTHLYQPDARGSVFGFGSAHG
ncbi:hypothetical protein [Streptacidiphilus sp. P02-A3a]|uniref:hypothetical protein n=1 Tax=Streptacidiphilus sp. P02-A3a TaxID=2704468 RepID=UPI0015FD31D2|nr:hypothetical protein [Streptacidiphilus sp. P02-A3a]QMU73326.1 hypothetical protein GXP74_38975 [Streptacidiphilus sp. P02-A3a]